MKSVEANITHKTDAEADTLPSCSRTVLEGSKTRLLGDAAMWSDGPSWTGITHLLIETKRAQE
jgi:hypothetical protein